MREIIAAVVLFLIAVFAFALSICSFREKGALLNNAFLYASEKERENMDKRPYYRQSAVVFLLIGLVFVLNGIGALLHIYLLSYIAVAVIFITLIYAIVSSVVIEKGNKKTKI